VKLISGRELEKANMKFLGLQFKQKKTRPAVDRSQRNRNATPVSSWPLTFNDAHSPALRLPSPFVSLHNRLPLRLQAKLTINEPGDQYEHEADRVAEQVMRMPDPAIRLQRKCGCGGSAMSADSCEECASTKVQRHAAGDGVRARAPAIVHDVLRSAGLTLDGSTRAFFENRFQRNFSDVRIHTDGRAADSAAAVNALAYTVGRHVVFGSGQFAPSTNRGRQLLAHELTHVIQQERHPEHSGDLPVGPVNDPREQQAEHNARSRGTGTLSSVEGVPSATLQRIGPAAAVGLGVAAFAAGFGAAYGIDYAMMTRERALRYGQELDTLYPGWLSALPPCPCAYPCATNTPLWVQDPGDLPTYHPGAAFSCRSTAAATGGSRHGQQCTYDRQRRLITSGPGAGTPDVYSPSGYLGPINLPYHHVYDVKTWRELEWATYNQYWRPDNRLGCPALDSRQSSAA